jgi:hypothetical protein
MVLKSTFKTEIYFTSHNIYCNLKTKSAALHFVSAQDRQRSACAAISPIIHTYLLPINTPIHFLRMAPQCLCTNVKKRRLAKKKTKSSVKGKNKN